MVLLVLAGCTTPSNPVPEVAPVVLEIPPSTPMSPFGKPIKPLFKEEVLGPVVDSIAIHECLKCKELETMLIGCVPAKNIVAVHNTAIDYIANGGTEDYWIYFKVNGTNEYYRFLAHPRSPANTYMKFVPSTRPNYCETCNRVLDSKARHEHTVVPLTDDMGNDATEERRNDD
jgi:hypothetical protein